MGPLQGLTVIEFSGLGPGPFAAMLLADLGASVISIERASNLNATRKHDVNARGKKSIALDLHIPEAVQTALHLIETADILIEGFRPGVMERLGLGPDVCLEKNPKLVFGRITGWGQTGPLAHLAGHDINYISITGALAAIRRDGEKPTPPLNLAGDYGGGSMFLIMGILAALYERQASGKGQVIDAAITDGSAVSMSIFNTLYEQGMWNMEAGNNLLDGGAHFYDTYQTKDDKFISIGSIEPQFYAILKDKLGLDDDAFANQYDRANWPVLKAQLEALFKQKTSAHWCELFADTDVCFAPVLNILEAPMHPHNMARQTYINVEGKTQPAPAPRFSRSKTKVPDAAHAAGADTDNVLRGAGLSQETINKLREKGALS